MKIVAFGDSFTYGEELSDRNNAWPQQLANRLGIKCLNLGEPGTSNDRIVSNLLRHFTDPENYDPSDIVVIAWTSPGRVEYSDELGTFDLWPGTNPTKFQKTHPWRLELSCYIDQYHNPLWLIQRYVGQLALTQAFLKSRGIRYVMCDTVKNEYYKNLYMMPAYCPMDLVDGENYFGWRHSGMAEWVGKAKRGAGGHFLDDGHAIVATKLHLYIKDKQWQQ